LTSDSNHVVTITPRRQRRIARLQPPTWLLSFGKTLEIYSLSGFSLIDIHLRVYNIVPMDSPIMLLAGDGDLHGVQEVFQQGKASPHDQDFRGWTLLDVCTKLPSSVQ
jgi:hypothetical protein